MPIDNWLMVYQWSPNNCIVSINNGLHLSQKYAWIFVRGHYLSRDALWGPDNVQRQICEHYFAPNRGFCVYCPSNISVNARENCLRTANCLWLRVFAFQCYLVRFYEQKQYIFLLLYSHSMFFDLELNFVRRVFPIGHKEISFEVYFTTPPALVAYKMMNSQRGL